MIFKATGVTVAAALATCATLLSGGPASAIEKRTFTDTTWITDKLGHSLAAIDFMKAIEKRTAGAVIFDIFWNGSLCGANDALMEIQAAGPGFQAEWDRNNAHLLFYGHTSLPLLASTKEINTVADMKDLTIRTVGHGVSAMKALGANPVATAPSEQYEALQRGVLDGAIYSADGMIDARLYEVAKRICGIGEYIGNYAMLYTAMNKDLWESLSPELQQIFTEESERVSKAYHSGFIGPYEDVACAQLANEVDLIAAFGDAESASSWRDEMCDFAMDRWMEDVWKDGVSDPAAVRDLYRATLAKYDSGEMKLGNRTCMLAAEAK